MLKPSQYELDTTLETLEYILEDLKQNESYARNTIETIEGAIEAMPRSDSELGDII